MKSVLGLLWVPNSGLDRVRQTNESLYRVTRVWMTSCRLFLRAHPSAGKWTPCQETTTIKQLPQVMLRFKEPLKDLKQMSRTVDLLWEKKRNVWLRIELSTLLLIKQYKKWKCEQLTLSSFTPEWKSCNLLKFLSFEWNTKEDILPIDSKLVRFITTWNIIYLHLYCIPQYIKSYRCIMS